jgi:hypothetical protein
MNDKNENSKGKNRKTQKGEFWVCPKSRKTEKQEHWNGHMPRDTGGDKAKMKIEKRKSQNSKTENSEFAKRKAESWEATQTPCQSLKSTLVVQGGFYTSAKYVTFVY